MLLVSSGVEAQKIPSERIRRLPDGLRYIYNALFPGDISGASLNEILLPALPLFSSSYC